MTVRREDLRRQAVGAVEPWEVLVIGGGATGLGVAVEAATRGFRTLLLEAHDFAKGTSSRSTKLVHGGVRYLREGDVPLVFEALRERRRLLANAPHLVRSLPFVIPAYRWWEGPYFGVGLKFYDLLGGRRELPSSRWLGEKEVLLRIPHLHRESLKGGVLFHDAQFDDARFAVALLRTFLDEGGVALNYCRVTGLRKEGGRIAGVEARDEETGRSFEIEARTVVNATGVFADRIRRMDDPRAEPLLRPSRGTHLVLEGHYLPEDHALLVPRTRDDRVLFAIPWHDRVLVGTTDVATEDVSLEPRATMEEVSYLLDHLGDWLTRPPREEDVRSVFAGLRPLVQEEGAGRTAEISRDDREIVSPSGLVTVVGGKWTTYREMGESTVDRLVEATDLPAHPSVTADLPLHGYTDAPDPDEPWRTYGADASTLWRLASRRPELDERLHPRLPYRMVQVVWAARQELARTVEDVLSRRTRALVLDARAAADAAPEVARILAEELGRDESWRRDQVRSFRALARDYTLEGVRPPSDSS